MATKKKKDAPKNPAAVAMGRIGGKASGIRKGFAAVSPEQMASAHVKAIATRRRNARARRKAEQQ
jgi:hypothetical protein